MFSFLGKLLSQIWNLLKKALPYILLAAAVFFTMGAVIPLTVPVIGGLGGAAAAWGALGAALLIAPGETAEVLGKAAQATGKVAASVAQALGSVVGAAGRSLLSALLPIAAIATGVWLLIGPSDEEEEEAPVVSSDAFDVFPRIA